MKIKNKIDNFSDKSDCELIDMYRLGSEPAFRTFFGRYSRIVLSVIRRAVHNKEEANDVFQDTFLSFQSHIKQPYFINNNPAAYLFRIAFNKANNLRKNNKHEPLHQYNELSEDIIQDEEEYDFLSKHIQDSLEEAFSHPDVQKKSKGVRKIKGPYSDSEKREISFSAFKNMPYEEKLQFAVYVIKMFYKEEQNEQKKIFDEEEQQKLILKIIEDKKPGEIFEQLNIETNDKKILEKEYKKLQRLVIKYREKFMEVVFKLWEN